MDQFFFTETLYWYEVDEYGNPAYDDSGYPIYLPKYEDGYIYNENSLVYPYVESYVSYLKTTFDLTTISGTLANSEQVSKLINLNITSPSYYTGCIYDMDAVIIVGNEDMHPANYALAQVRPVIIIPANEIEK